MKFSAVLLALCFASFRVAATNDELRDDIGTFSRDIHPSLFFFRKSNWFSHILRSKCVPELYKEGVYHMMFGDEHVISGSKVNLAGEIMRDVEECERNEAFYWQLEMYKNLETEQMQKLEKMKENIQNKFDLFLK